ncbi:hypothetical protein SAMN05720472_2903 [Fibrobacter sp. UWR3]|uniref:hypothetical protein n=1 Tax=Fibrobacter sp. UWR3 TaxID=1896217 RepID=UPI000910F19B|nr:hypothetical protein [Fibrobacter sp. UWR3]SHM99539.1 hypothetical protein SAMN05720472_2903 [Fibrobacter sp. UWR3]
MHFRKNVFSIFAATIVLTALCASQSAAEEEKSLWQRFVDWFKPAPSLEGEGPLYDELRELETQIDRIEGRYSRERRPGNKTRLKKEMEDLKTKREKLIDRIREEEKAKKNAPAVQPVAASSSATAADTSKAAQADICTPDTVFVRDTVIVHDTLYVIVSGKPGEQQAPAAQSNTAKPAGEASPTDSATASQAIPAADSATVPGNK